MRLEEQRPDELLLWPFLVRVLNGGLDFDNFGAVTAEGHTPFNVEKKDPVGAMVIGQSTSGNTWTTVGAAGVTVHSEPSGLLVKVVVF
jgi:hypothetical protein